MPGKKSGLSGQGMLKLAVIFLMGLVVAVAGRSMRAQNSYAGSHGDAD